MCYYRIATKILSTKVYIRWFTKGSCKNINTYLLDANDVYIERTNESISHFAPMAFGSMPRDGGHLILTPIEKDDIISKYPQSSKFIKNILGPKNLSMVRRGTACG